VLAHEMLQVPKLAARVLEERSIRASCCSVDRALNEVQEVPLTALAAATQAGPRSVPRDRPAQERRRPPHEPGARADVDDDAAGRAALPHIAHVQSVTRPPSTLSACPVR